MFNNTFQKKLCCSPSADHDQDEMQLETNISEMDDMITKEPDNEIKQQKPDDTSEGLIVIMLFF